MYADDEILEIIDGFKGIPNLDREGLTIRVDCASGQCKIAGLKNALDLAGTQSLFLQFFRVQCYGHDLLPNSGDVSCGDAIYPLKRRYHVLFDLRGKCGI